MKRDKQSLGKEVVGAGGSSLRWRSAKEAQNLVGDPCVTSAPMRDSAKCLSLVFPILVSAKVALGPILVDPIERGQDQRCAEVDVDDYQQTVVLRHFS